MQRRQLHRAQGLCRLPHFYKWAPGGGHREYRRTANKKLTKLCMTITNALTKTTNCSTFRAKNVEGHDQKIFTGASRRTGAPTFKLVPAPVSLWIWQSETVWIHKRFLQRNHVVSRAVYTANYSTSYAHWLGCHIFRQKLATSMRKVAEMHACFKPAESYSRRLAPNSALL